MIWNQEEWGLQICSSLSRLFWLNMFLFFFFLSHILELFLFSISVKKSIEILIGIVLNMYIASGNMDMFIFFWYFIFFNLFFFYFIAPRREVPAPCVREKRGAREPRRHWSRRESRELPLPAWAAESPLRFFWYFNMGSLSICLCLLQFFCFLFFFNQCLIVFFFLYRYFHFFG